MSVEELLHSFLKLDEHQQSEFLDRAYAAATALPFDSEWLAEIERRSAAVDAGRMGVHSAEEVFVQARQRKFPNG